MEKFISAYRTNDKSYKQEYASLYKGKEAITLAKPLVSHYYAAHGDATVRSTAVIEFPFDEAERLARDILQVLGKEDV